jgi:hypothetical protein
LKRLLVHLGKEIGLGFGFLQSHLCICKIHIVAKMVK